MQAIWKTILSIGTSEDPVILVDGVAVPVRVRRSARARSYRLTLDSKDGGLRLSLPTRANLKRALGWAQDHAEWVQKQMAIRPDGVALADGALFALEGHEIQIVWQSGATRRIRLEEGQLIVGGSAESVEQRVLRWLKVHAKTVLEAETRTLAAAHGLTVASVGVGDTRSRWGSCTSNGAIRYSWRLILAPVFVRRSTVAHELAHLIHMDHSPAFHAAHARILGSDPKPARAWLKAHGVGLHRIGAS